MNIKHNDNLNELKNKLMVDFSIVNSIQKS